DQRQQGKANSTIRLYLSALRVMLQRAQRLGLIDTLPLLPEPRTLALPEPRDLVLEPHWVELQIAAMRRLADPPAETITSRARRTESQRLKVAAMAELTTFLRYMGCRVNEALTLTWDNFDSRGNVQFILTKGKRARRLPMFPEAAAAVAARRKAGADRPFGICYDTYLKVHYETRNIVCDALSLSDYVRQNWVIHTLRHTRLTELAQMGWSSAQIKEWAGHSSILVSERYIHGSAIRFPVATVDG
ncbi:MAG: tyrosine-type recombinase/integrase, partial [Cyanobacteriota bacterium]